MARLYLAHSRGLAAVYARFPVAMRGQVRKSVDAVLALLAQHPAAGEEIAGMRKP